MINIGNVETLAELADLKRQYMQQTTAPLDGMWLCGFVPMARHFKLCDGDDLVGFCCVNDDGFLLQFHLTPDHQNHSAELFDSIAQGTAPTVGAVKGAFASTAEPRYLSLCLDHFSKFEVHALMYQQAGSAVAQSESEELELSAVDMDQLPQAIEFAVAAIGAPEEWLSGYYTNLIQRGELFGVWSEGRLIATGESRGYDEHQTDCADLGVIVAESERGRGMATRVLRQLATRNEVRGLRSICSTEKGNVAAQTAITRAGFFASNRILQFQS